MQYLTQNQLEQIQHHDFPYDLMERKFSKHYYGILRKWRKLSQMTRMSKNAANLHDCVSGCQHLAVQIDRN